MTQESRENYNCDKTVTEDKDVVTQESREKTTTVTRRLQKTRTW